MVRPIPAVGLASALVQIIDFSINTLRKDHPIFQPSDASTPPVENAAFLQNLIDNLFRLTDLIDQSELKKLQQEKTTAKVKGAKLSEAATQLIKLSDLTKETTNPLIDALITAQSKGSFGDPKWGTAREALTNGVWKNSEVKSVKKKLRTLRREVETALLLAMRQYLDQSAESGLPVFTSEDSGRLHHWEKWQNTALDAIHSNDWKSNKKKNIEEFSKIVDELVLAENEVFFSESIFKLLWFEELDERVNGIPAPATGTLDFVFGESGLNVGGLLEWFASSRGEGVYWVTGKPGSGKTTLMKHLFRNPRTFSSLEAWSGHSPGITSGYFFWHAGSHLQNSPIGLLRTILYESLQDMIFGPLNQDQIVIQWLFSNRWSQFTSYGGGLQDFTFAGLRTAFNLMVSDVSKKFLFMLDGIDEMDAYPTELMDLILTAAKKDHVKFCVSSRANPMFQSAFEARPRCVLDEWTKSDIQAHVHTRFSLETKLERLRGKMDGLEETNIVATVTDKAAGVFLFAVLATTFLLQGLQEGDDFLVLKDRADALPHTLDDLLAHILSRLDAADLEQVYKIHSLLQAQPHTAPDLLQLSFALTAELPATLAADVRPLKPTETSKRIEDLRALFETQCKNLFEVFDAAPPAHTGDVTNLKATYTHRCISDYLSTHAGLFTQVSQSRNSFNTTQQWANAHLWTLKTLSPSAPDAGGTANPLPLWRPLSLALEAALNLYSSTKKLPLSYIDAALSTALYQHLKFPSFSPGAAASSDLPHFPSSPATTLTTPLDLALLLNLQSYLALKLKSAERKDVRHASEFAREMRRRWGSGGEEKWVGGEERGALRAEYGKVRGEVEGLVEYYGKAVRFGSAKPWVEVVEWE